MSANRRMMADREKGDDIFKATKGNVDERNGSGITIRRKNYPIHKIKSITLNLEVQSKAVLPKTVKQQRLEINN